MEDRETIPGVIEKMHQRLQAEYGTDFSYVVCARGNIIAASTKNEGKIPADQLKKLKVHIDD